MTRTFQYVKLTNFVHWLVGFEETDRQPAQAPATIVIKPNRLTDALAETHHGQYSILMELPE